MNERTPSYLVSQTQAVASGTASPDLFPLTRRALRGAVIALPRCSANSSRSLRSPLNPFWRQDCTANRVPPRNPLSLAPPTTPHSLHFNKSSPLSVGKTVFRKFERKREVSIDYFTGKDHVVCPSIKPLQLSIYSNKLLVVL